MAPSAASRTPPLARLGLKWRELSRAENHMIFPSQIDGDLVPSGADLDVRVRPGALVLRTPADST